jgi:hypothetical protein
MRMYALALNATSPSQVATDKNDRPVTEVKILRCTVNQ